METESGTVWDARPVVSLSGNSVRHNKPKSASYPSPPRSAKRISQMTTDGNQLGVPSSVSSSNSQEENKSTSSRHSSTSPMRPSNKHYDSANAVPSSILDDYTLILNRLGKIYSSSFFSYFGCGSQKLKRAVDDLSLALKPGERFGLLGKLAR